MADPPARTPEHPKVASAEVDDVKRPKAPVAKDEAKELSSQKPAEPTAKTPGTSDTKVTSAEKPPKVTITEVEKLEHSSPVKPAMHSNAGPLETDSGSEDELQETVVPVDSGEIEESEILKIASKLGITDKTYNFVALEAAVKPLPTDWE